MNGDSVDSSGNGKNGTDTSVTYSTSTITNLGQYEYMNANTDSINFATGTDITSGWSLGFWLRKDAAAGTAQRIWFNLVNGADPPLMYSVSVSTAIQWWDGTNNTTLTGCTVPADDTWYHYVINRYTDSQIECYRNNTSLFFSSALSAATFKLGRISLGGSDANSAIHLAMDEIYIRNAVTATSTRASLYNSGNGDEICVSVGCASSSTPPNATTTVTLGDLLAPLNLLDLIIDAFGISLGILLIVKLKYGN